jgi:hypothetical protein
MGFGCHNNGIRKCSMMPRPCGCAEPPRASQHSALSPVAVLGRQDFSILPCIPSLPGTGSQENIIHGEEENRRKSLRNEMSSGGGSPTRCSRFRLGSLTPQWLDGHTIFGCIYRVLNICSKKTAMVMQMSQLITGWISKSRNISVFRQSFVAPCKHVVSHGAGDSHGKLSHAGRLIQSISGVSAVESVARGSRVTMLGVLWLIMLARSLSCATIVHRPSCLLYPESWSHSFIRLSSNRGIHHPLIFMVTFPDHSYHAQY